MSVSIYDLTVGNDPIFRPTPRVTNPSGFSVFDATVGSQPIANPQRLGIFDVTVGAGPPRPRERGSGGGGSGETQTSTNGVTQQETFRYSPTLPALTAEQQAALANRRRQASRAFEETEASVTRQRQRAEAEAVRAREEIARQQQLQSRAGMQTLAGRGVGRSPMFVNPFQRQLAEQSQRQVGQLQSGLADTLAQLESALRQADIGRERELAQIDFDAGSFRSDVARLLGG